LSARRKIKTGKTCRVPVIDMSVCTDCESCLELCPSVFKRNKDTGLIEVIELSEYPQKEIQEVINCCPKGCIEWEEIRGECF
jgi:ferredoxin